jgi:hypothetical protein
MLISTGTLSVPVESVYDSPEINLLGVKKRFLNLVSSEGEGVINGLYGKFRRPGEASGLIELNISNNFTN